MLIKDLVFVVVGRVIVLTLYVTNTTDAKHRMSEYYQ